MSNIKADNFTWKTGEATAQSGTTVTGPQIVYGVAKAWCNYTPASPTNNGSFNISSLTRLGTGLITFNMTNALPSSSFSYCDGGYNTASADGPWNSIRSGYTVSSTSFTVQCFNSSGSAQDQSFAYFAVFR